MVIYIIIWRVWFYFLSSIIVLILFLLLVLLFFPMDTAPFFGLGSYGTRIVLFVGFRMSKKLKQ